MRNKILFVSLLVVAALALGACSPTVVADSASPVRTMNVTGAGQVFLAPDIAYINIGVRSEEATASEAVTGNNRATQKVITALKKAGVDEKDIRTTNFSIWPNQQYSPMGEQLGISYVVDNSVFVTVRDLGALGDLIDAAVKAGANTVNSVQFNAEDKTDAVKTAREEAIKDAKVQAQELADAAGVKLGEIQSIEFYDSAPIPYLDSYGKGGGGGAVAEASVPIQPGQLTLTVTVNVRYEIK